MQRVVAVAIVVSGWALLSQNASAQSLERRGMPSSQAIPTVEDAPQGTVESFGSFNSIVAPPSSSSPLPTQPTFSEFSDSPFRFSTLDRPYTSYSSLTFETPITADRVKLRVNFEPGREGGNFGLGLPLE